MSNLKMSVITLTWNSGKTIAETVKSVLSQNYNNYEHIIIDNCSTDDTLPIIRQLYIDNKDKLKIISEPDKGISDGFNKGIHNASGEIITFLNSDDHYLYKSVFLDVAQAFSDDQVMYTHGDMIFEDDTYGTNQRAPLLCSLEEAMPYNHPTMFVRAILYTRHGLFDLDYKYAMDFHFICRLHKTANQPLYKSTYIRSRPLVIMKAGGVSNQYELDAIKELTYALKENNFHSNLAKKNMAKRAFRIKIKSLLYKLRLTFFSRYWRNHKWN